MSWPSAWQHARCNRVSGMRAQVPVRDCQKIPSQKPSRGCRDPMGDGMVGSAKLKRAGPLKVFALQEHPCAGDLVQASTGKDRCDVRNAIQSMHSILNERERHVAHRPSHAGSRQPRRENRRYWSGKRDLNPRPSPWQF